MLVMVRVALPILVRVTVLKVLTIPTVWFPKLMLVGESFTTGATPTPVSGTDCGLSGALSVIVTAPVRVPSAVGVKITVIVQFELAAKLPPTGQVFV
jgi:hypothetical protein